MILGILEAGEPPAELLDEFGRYPAMFRDLLGEADATLEFKTYDVRAGELPAGPDACDAFLVTGSAASAFDEEGWIRGLEAFIRVCAAQGRKLVGICFGHQVIAQALGGAVERSRNGWGLGRRTFAIARRRPWMDEPLETCALFFSHQDQVTVLPPGAETLAGDAHCPIQMYAVSNGVLCIQGHPEFSPPYAQAHLKLRRERLGPERYGEALQEVRKPVDAPVIARWIVKFLRDG